MSPIWHAVHAPPKKLRPSSGVALACSPVLPHEPTALLATAHALQAASQIGGADALLRGKRFGLLCESADVGDAALFRRAAVELGAQVAHIRSPMSELSTSEDIKRTARMLGRLYDAVECQGMAPALVQQLGAHAGVPVYNGVASEDHPTAKLADLLGVASSAVDRRRFALQAVLLQTTA